MSQTGSAISHRQNSSGLLGSTIAKNSVWLMIGRLGSQGMALVFSIVVARRLGDVGLGQYAFMTSLMFIGNLASTFGTDMLVMREIAGRRDFSVLPGSLFVQLTISVPFIVIALFAAPSLPNQTSASIQAIQIYSFALIPMAFYSVLSALLRGLERMGSFTWLNLFSGVSLVGLTWFVIQPQSSIITVAYLLLVAQALAALAAWILSQPFFPDLNWKVDPMQLRNLVVAAAPIAILGLLGALFQRTGVILTTVLLGAAPTGIFSAALRIVEAAKLGHFALLGALFPVMAQTSLAQNPERQNIFKSSLRLLLLVSLVLSSLLFFLSGFLIPLLYGNQFEGSVGHLSILAWVLIPVSFTHFYSLRLLAIKQERMVLISLFAGVVALLLFSGMIIPSRGLAAVSFGTLLAEVVQAVVLLSFWQRMKVS
jgi:O-antigen/teichoic acid export membrane protein